MVFLLHYHSSGGINSFDPKDPSYNKVAEVLFYFGKISFSMMLPILAGFIGRSIADRPGFIVGMIGGILADPSILGLKSDLLAYTPSGFLGAFSSRVLSRWNYPRIKNCIQLDASFIRWY